MTTDSALRVLYLLPDFGVGGGQVILLRTAEAAAAKGTAQVVVGLRGGPMRSRFDDAGITTQVMDQVSTAGYVGAVKGISRVVREERIDVLVSFNTPEDRTVAQLVGLRTATPVVIWFMSMAIPLLRFPPPRGRELAFLKRLTLFGPNYLSVRRAAGLAALSSAAAQSFAHHLRLEPGRFEIVAPGLPASFYELPLDQRRLEALAASLGIGPGEGPVLLNVGMLIDLKGQQVLVPAMAQVLAALPHARLLLVGEGENRPSLEAAVRAHGLTEHVTLLGHRHDVAALLQLADGLVSASRSEGFGMAVLEAMASAKPVVAVHTPAFDEFATDGLTARFVARQDAGLLAEAIIDVFGQPGRASALGTAGRRAAEGFRVEDTADALLQVARQAVSGSVRRDTSGPRARLARAVRDVGSRWASSRRSEIVVRSGPGKGLRLAGGAASADYRPGTNEAPVQEAIVASLSPGAVFYDVGANVGFFALLAARAVGPTGRVVAFEPVPEMIAAIGDNARLNGLRVAVIPLAVGGADGRELLHLARHPGGAALASAGTPPDWRGDLEVEVRTLDSLVAEGVVPPPTVVKIDVEGAEGAVLAGMAGLLRASRPVIFCEFDAPTAAEVDRKVGEFSHFVSSHDYVVRYLPLAYDRSGWVVTHIVAEPVGLEDPGA